LTLLSNQTKNPFAPPMKKLFSVAIFLPLLLFAISTNAAGTTIYGIRYGAHVQFDRVVLELSAPVDCQIEVVDSLQLRIHLSRVNIAPEFRVSPLPKRTVSVLSMKATGGGEAPFSLTIRLRTSATTRVMKLGGTPYRIAVDVTPRQAESPPREEPTYIPGDRAYPTKFGANTAPSLGADSAKIHAILAHFFTARGDSAKALREALAYEALTGNPLYIGPETITTRTVPKLQAPYVVFPWLKVDYLIAFGAGVLGYILSALVAISMGGWGRRRVRDQADGLMARAEKIRSTLKPETEETSSPAQTEAPQEQSEQTSEEPVAQEVVEAVEVQRLKESAMDRRIQQVLQLAADGKTAADIAQELEMSQDEIKLILDLNR
jgi:hypothetical protein